ncbi:hypothetical protein SSS_10647 [Sarcoptes scabiei]|nr:hypothetical protein SSS_10647 [Sarcoptes scabiei]
MSEDIKLSNLFHSRRIFLSPFGRLQSSRQLWQTIELLNDIFFFFVFISFHFEASRSFFQKKNHLNIQIGLYFLKNFASKLFRFNSKQFGLGKRFNCRRK